MGKACAIAATSPSMLKWLIDNPHRVAMNMDALAKRGRVELDREGWDGMPNTKRYRLSLGMLDQVP